MFSRRLVSLIVVALAAGAVSLGCAATDDDDLGGGGDGGEGAAAALVGDDPLTGSDLPEKTLGLTFDDGPGTRTSELADFLADKGVKATFFINGVRVSGRQSAISTVVRRGHLLANHTQNHRQLTTLSASQIVSEVEQTDDIIADVQPRGPWVLRAPYGAWNETVAEALNGTRMQKYVGSVFWDEGGTLTNSAAADWDCWSKGVSVQRCGELYLQEIRSKKRGVVLMHDIHDKTVDMMKQILPTLIAEGYKFVRVSDVPSVRRAIRASGGGDGAVDGDGNDDGRGNVDGNGDVDVPVGNEPCSSAAGGRRVDENVCIQSRTDQKWYRCVNGKWKASAGFGAARCSQSIGL